MTAYGTPPHIARCPGPSTADIIARDGDNAPKHLMEETWVDLGSEDINFDRYTSQAFFDDEVENMWKRVWQWACREEDVPEPGDYFVYDVVDHSVLVVRDDAGQLHAYPNACLHRGTQLKPSNSCGSSKELRCPFHGISWKLDGQLGAFPCSWDFPHVDKQQWNLPELKLDTWGGFIWINFDQNAAPLQDYLDILPEHFKQWDLSNRFVAKHIRKRLPANWKACVEAFLESWHVLETHPQGIATVGDANSQYDVYGKHISRFVHLVGFPSPHIDRDMSEQDMLDALFGEGMVDELGDDKADKMRVPDGSTARETFAKHLQKTLGEAYERDFSHLSITETIDAIEYFVFPNTCIFPSLLFPMVYRFRPEGRNPDVSIFDLIFLQPNPESGVIPDPAEPIDLDVHDSFSQANVLDPGLALIYDQDTGNLEAQQRGFKSSFKKGQTLGNYQEVRIRHLHHSVDQYLDNQ